MSIVYIYGSLRKAGIREDALGADARDVKMMPASVTDFKEEFVAIGTQRYPTLVPKAGNVVNGDVLFVNNRDMQRLDNWEQKYRRHPIFTNEYGLAWTFLLQDQKTKNADGPRA